MAGASASTSFRSFVRGHHDYHRSWTTVTGELFPFKREVSNDHDPFTVATLKDGKVVGHVPKSLSKITSCFLNYTVMWYSVKLNGRSMNRESDWEWKFPVIY